MCSPLALEGGESLGACQVGVMIGLTEALPGGDIEWNIVTGISTGTLNSAVPHFNAPRRRDNAVARNYN